MCRLLILLGLGVVLAAAELRPVPPALDATRVQGELKTLYPKDYAARSREGRAAFAQRLLALAEASTDKPVERYVLLRECLAFAAKGGDVPTGLRALDLLDEAYLVVPMDERLAFAKEVAGSIATPEAADAYLAALGDLAERAIAADDYANAGRAAVLADTFARRLKDRAPGERSKALVARVKALEKAYAALGEIRDPLGRLTPTGHSRYGWFLCVAKQDWTSGLDHLRQGDDAILTKLADQERVADPAGRLAAADGWYAHAQGLRGDERTETLVHAALLYRQLLPGLSGMDLARIDQRCAELATILGPRLLLAGYPEGPVLLLTFEPPLVEDVRVHDVSPQGHRGVLTGAVSTEAAAHGTALRFAGGRLTIPNHPSLQTAGSMTLLLWVRPDDIGEARRNPWQKSYGGEGTLTLEPNGVVNLFHGTTGQDVEGGYENFAMDRVLTVETWAHLAVVRDLANRTLTWYRDGTVVKSEPTPFDQHAPSAADVMIGDGYAGAWMGLIDEVALYPRALTAEEVGTVYEATRRGR